MTLKDHTNNIKFWKRLRSFITDVQTNDPASQEEKDMIVNQCDNRIIDMQQRGVCTCGTEEHMEPKKRSK